MSAGWRSRVRATEAERSELERIDAQLRAVEQRRIELLRQEQQLIARQIEVSTRAVLRGAPHDVVPAQRDYQRLQAQLDGVAYELRELSSQRAQLYDRRAVIVHGMHDRSRTGGGSTASLMARRYRA